jgi:rhodanese-related sulfurtransferase
MSNKKSKSTAAQHAARTPANAARSRSTVRWVLGGLGLVGVVVVGLLVRQGTGATASSVPTASNTPAAPTQSAANLPAEISAAEASAKRDAGAFVLDVREPDEWKESHIPGSTLIPLGELAARVKDVPRDREVIVVCRSGNRSRTGRTLLINADFTQVTSLAGGLTAWAAANLPTVAGP